MKVIFTLQQVDKHKRGLSTQTQREGQPDVFNNLLLLRPYVVCLVRVGVPGLIQHDGVEGPERDAGGGQRALRLRVAPHLGTRGCGAALATDD